jgi:hypothetical protein
MSSWNVVSTPGPSFFLMAQNATLIVTPTLVFLCPSCPAGGANASTSSVSFLPQSAEEQVLFNSTTPFDFSSQNLAPVQVTFFTCMRWSSFVLPPNVVYSPSYLCPATCYDAPCQNNGTCSAAIGVVWFSCACPIEFGGDRCQFVNQCNTNNGGCDPVLSSCSALADGTASCSMYVLLRKRSESNSRFCVLFL